MKKKNNEMNVTIDEEEEEKNENLYKKNINFFQSQQ